MNEKVEHVVRATQDRFHTCHWPGCEKQVPPAKWGCRTHWFRLPKNLRNQIWAAYAPSQENRLDPSEDYVTAVHLARRWIEENAVDPF